MTSRFYHDPRINIESAAAELERMFISEGYQPEGGASPAPTLRTDLYTRRRGSCCALVCC